MKRCYQIFTFLILFGVIGFGSSIIGFSQNVSDSISNSQKAKNFITVGEWESYFNQKINSGSKVLPEEYAQAAKKAFSEKNYILSVIWYEEAKTGNYSEAEMYSQIAAIYRQLGNLSEEIKSMNYYLMNFPNGQENGSFRERLFSIYTSAKNYDKLTETWLALADSSRKKESLLNTFFIIQKEKNIKESCDSLAIKLLMVNPKNVNALEWLGEKYYWLGENRYQQSAKNYERNKTSLQHLITTQEFEKVSADFKKALTYFDILWEISPSSKYAPYLANIHARFKNDQKVSYYKGFIK